MQDAAARCLVPCGSSSAAKQVTSPINEYDLAIQHVSMSANDTNEGVQTIRLHGIQILASGYQAKYEVRV